jgi:chemotaxis response regulator CheB
VSSPRSIRVLLVDLPPLLRELVAGTLDSEPGLELAYTEPEAERTAVAEAATRPDVVIAGLDAGRLPPACERLIADRASLRVIGIEAEDGTAALYLLRPERTPLGEVTLTEVAEVIRATVARG